MTQNQQDWEAIGRNIQQIVERAVNSQDFQKLNQTVRRAVDMSVDVGSQAVRKAVDSARAAQASRPVPLRSVPPRKLYGSTGGRTLTGVLKLIGGIPLAVHTLLRATVGVIASPLFAVGLGLQAVGALWLLGTGSAGLAMVGRFKTYRRTLGGRTYCQLEALAGRVGKSQKYVRKDLQKMIGSGLFLEGHFDKSGQCLITSDETYQYYEQSRLRLEQQRREQQAQPKASAPDTRVQEVLDRGNGFLAQIRKCNDDIPGQDVSEKISRIELLVQRIFQRVQTHPEIVPDLKKMMDYYLPMTVKLLQAYADMDAQPVQGENIQASKREIEATLDTLNLAFEKLLDSVFAETALDVSSDITVLNTLLAQEGLTEDGFRKEDITMGGDLS